LVTLDPSVNCLFIVLDDQQLRYSKHSAIQWLSIK